MPSGYHPGPALWLPARRLAVQGLVSASLRQSSHHVSWPPQPPRLNHTSDYSLGSEVRFGNRGWYEVAGPNMGLRIMCKTRFSNPRSLLRSEHSVGDLEFKTVTNFTYLGSQSTIDNNMSQKFTARLLCATRGLWHLVSRLLFRQTKLRMLCSDQFSSVPQI